MRLRPGGRRSGGLFVRVRRPVGYVGEATGGGLGGPEEGVRGIIAGSVGHGRIGG